MDEPNETTEAQDQAAGTSAPTTPPPEVTSDDARVRGKAFAQMRHAAEKRGAQRALEDLAKAAGFNSSEEMAKQLSRLKNPPEQKRREEQRPQPQQARGNGSDKWQRRLAEEQRLRRVEQERRRQAEIEKASVEFERKMERAAFKAGIRRPELAMTLLDQATANLSEEDVKKFDESAFFARLKKSDPYLFEERVEPATTGVDAGANATPPAASAAAVLAAAATGKAPDIMDDATYKRELSRFGIEADGITSSPLNKGVS